MLMPNQVYRLDPVTRRVRVVATDFTRCNGIALSEDGKLAYMYVFLFQSLEYNSSHLCLHRGSEPLDQILPLSMDFLEATRLNLLPCKSNSSHFFLIYLNLTTSPSPLPPALCEMHRYAFDVDPDSQTFLNRRVFAYVDTGIPDGIQIDKNGNVYAGCGDGVQVIFFFYFPFNFFF